MDTAPVPTPALNHGEPESHGLGWDLNSGPRTPRPHFTGFFRGSELTGAVVQYPVTTGVPGCHGFMEGSCISWERLAPVGLICLQSSDSHISTCAQDCGHLSPRSPLSEHAGWDGMLQGAASTTQSEQHAGREPSMDPAH